MAELIDGGLASYVWQADTAYDIRTHTSSIIRLAKVDAATEERLLVKLRDQLISESTSCLFSNISSRDVCACFVYPYKFHTL